MISQHFINGQFDCNQHGFGVLDEINLRFKDFKMTSYYQHYGNIEHEHYTNVYVMFTQNQKYQH